MSGQADSFLAEAKAYSGRQFFNTHLFLKPKRESREKASWPEAGQIFYENSLRTVPLSAGSTVVPYSALQWDEIAHRRGEARCDGL